MIFKLLCICLASFTTSMAFSGPINDDEERNTYIQIISETQDLVQSELQTQKAPQQANASFAALLFFLLQQEQLPEKTLNLFQELVPNISDYQTSIKAQADSYVGAAQHIKKGRISTWSHGMLLDFNKVNPIALIQEIHEGRAFWRPIFFKNQPFATLLVDEGFIGTNKQAWSHFYIFHAETKLTLSFTFKRTRSMAEGAISWETLHAWRIRSGVTSMKEALAKDATSQVAIQAFYDILKTRHRYVNHTESLFLHTLRLFTSIHPSLKMSSVLISQFGWMRGFFAGWFISKAIRKSIPILVVSGALFLSLDFLKIEDKNEITYTSAELHRACANSNETGCAARFLKARDVSTPTLQKMAQTSSDFFSYSNLN